MNHYSLQRQYMDAHRHYFNHMDQIDNQEDFLTTLYAYIGECVNQIGNENSIESIYEQLLNMVQYIQDNRYWFDIIGERMSGFMTAKEHVKKLIRYVHNYLDNNDKLENIYKDLFHKSIYDSGIRSRKKKINKMNKMNEINMQKN